MTEGEIDFTDDGTKFNPFENMSPEEMEIREKACVNSFPTEENKEKIKFFLGEIYEKIITLLKEYVDLREDYYILAATWIIGTYIHSSFTTYPYLFLNAMRGSGKSRLLNLIASISYKGNVIGSPTEAVLFRAPPGETLCLDEFEGIMRKGNESLREILNASYKKGMKIRRMKQKKVNGVTEQISEEFEPYRPICMANIWGMEEVLGDRCITLILEKSDREDVMRLIEDFTENYQIKWIKTGLSTILVSLCRYFSVVRGIEKWNLYIKLKYNTLYTQTTLNTQNTQTTLKFTDEELEIFNKIHETGINGRNLELFFPLLLVGKFISDDVFNSILKVASDLTKERRQEEMIESQDVSFIDFISRLEQTLNYKSVKALTLAFRNFLGELNENEDKWLNEKWVGRALKRLGLTLDKRRVAGGREVTINISKAKQKMEKFRQNTEKLD